MSEIVSQVDGRKVFFIYPHFETEKVLLKEVVKSEYEAYPLDCHDKAHRLINEYRNSILLLNINHKLSLPEWNSYAGAIKNSQGMEDIKIGAMFKDHWDIDFQSDEVRSGNLSSYIHISRDIEKPKTEILKLLAKNNARGRRKYLRARCKDVHKASFSLKTDDTIHQGEIYDVSSFGMSCSFNDSYVFKKHIELKDLQLRLNGMISRGSGDVVWISDDHKKFVVRFNPLNSDKFKSNIQNYIYNVMQTGFKTSIKEKFK